ncbi:hypothetical protein RB195_017137 [Necator americanus]|uniref:Uncharacterized protein n=1 Tax=Necator americanus TaxID=51031 RepID=A0ABR1C7G7_NECAM
MLPGPCSSCSISERFEIKKRVRKAQRDAMVDLVNSTIDTFLSKPCDEPQVLTIRVPDINVTVAELTVNEASFIVNNPHYDKMLEQAENKKRVHAACAAARQFLVEHSITKNPFPPDLQKTRKIPGPLPGPDRVDIPILGGNGPTHRERAGFVLHPSGIGSSYTTDGTTVASSAVSSLPHDRSSTNNPSYPGSSDQRG